MSSTLPQSQMSWTGPDTCIIHDIVQNHKGELRKILREARDVAKRPPPPPNFGQIPICAIGHPSHLTNYTIELSESKYTNDYPEWKTESKAVPPQILYFDKLITLRTPYIRSHDLEEKFRNLRSSVHNVKTKNFNEWSDYQKMISFCQGEIWRNMQPILGNLSFGNTQAIQVKAKFMIHIKRMCNDSKDQLKNAIIRQQTINDIQKKIVDLLIRESKTFGYYANRVGEMGEVVVKQSIHQLLSKRNIPSLTLSGFRISKYLGDSLERVGIALPQDAEMDTATFIPNGDSVNINFVQTKVLFPSESEDSFEEKIKDKINYGLSQTIKDLKALLRVMPDISESQLEKLNIATFSALPVTNRTDKICESCAKMVIFKDDLDDKVETQESIAQTMVDLLLAESAASSHGLTTKLNLENIQPPTPESLEMYKRLNSRYIGVSSIHPMKNYSTFLSKQERQFEDIQKSVKKQPQRALYLTGEQTSAIHNNQFILVGTFGSGKTTVLELSLLNILEKKKLEDPPSHIFFVVWDDSKDLLERFRRFQEDFEGVQVYSRDEIFQLFGAKQDKKSRVTSLNNLCRAMAEKLKIASKDQVFLLTDEMNPNPIEDNLDNFDWRGIETRGINIMLTLKPITSDILGNRSKSPQVLSPEHIPIIRLDRVLRCTQYILNLVQGLIEASLADSSIYSPNINFSLKNVTPGHEILGEKPEYISLPPCSCRGLCQSPVKHLLTDNFNTFHVILTKLLVGKEIPQSNITILLHTQSDRAAAKEWLVGRLGGEYRDVRVKLLDEFRGMESPVLLFINEDDGIGGLPADALEGMTRVTSHVVIIVNKGGKDRSDLSTTLLKMCQQNLARDATGKYKGSTEDVTMIDSITAAGDCQGV